MVLDRVFPVAEGRTDARGIVTLSAPADAMTQWIFGYKPGVGLDYFENYAEPSAPVLAAAGAGFARPERYSHRSRPGGGFGGQARARRRDHAARRPQEGQAEGGQFRRFAKARTDAARSRDIRLAAGRHPCRTSLFVASPWYETSKYTVFDPDTPDAEATTVRVVRATPISGKVSRPDGSPAAGISVTAESQVYGNAHLLGPGRARTAADGSYTIDVRPGQGYTMSIADDEWSARRQSVDVEEGKPRTGVDLRLEKAA